MTVDSKNKKFSIGTKEMSNTTDFTVVSDSGDRLVLLTSRDNTRLDFKGKDLVEVSEEKENIKQSLTE